MEPLHQVHVLHVLSAPELNAAFLEVRLGLGHTTAVYEESTET